MNLFRLRAPATPAPQFTTQYNMTIIPVLVQVLLQVLVAVLITVLLPVLVPLLALCRTSIKVIAPVNFCYYCTVSCLIILY